MKKIALALSIFSVAVAVTVIAQTPANAPAQWTTTMPIMYSSPWPKPVSFIDKITKEGHYVATLDDPNNEWRCAVSGGENPSAVVIVCIKNPKPMNDEREPAKK